jgi:hypothetical protein
MNWLTFALLTVVSWGVYGVILHKGRGLMPMGPETGHAGLKAFLFVCVAYAIIGLISAFVLKARGSNFSFTGSGISVSLLAGIAGAMGALTLVLALGAAASPLEKGGGGFGAAAAAAVMPIVFAGAPVINTLVAMLLHKPEKGVPPQFIAGCVLAVIGAFMVAKYAPSNTGSGAHAPAPAAGAAAGKAGH